MSSSSQSTEPVTEERDIDIRTSIEPGSNTVWVRTGSEQEMDLPSSPSSSGYAGEGGGSTSATTGSAIEIEHDDEIEEEDEEQLRIRNQIDEISITDSNTDWIPGKRHQDEVLALNSPLCSACITITISFIISTNTSDQMHVSVLSTNVSIRDTVLGVPRRVDKSV